MIIVLLNWSCHDLVHRLRCLVSLDWLTVNLSDESTLAINMISDSALVTIGINQIVFSLGLISLASFLLPVHISGMIIVNIVVELVVGRSVVFFFLMITVVSLLIIMLSCDGANAGNKHDEHL